MREVNPGVIQYPRSAWVDRVFFRSLASAQVAFRPKAGFASRLPQSSHTFDLGGPGVSAPPAAICCRVTHFRSDTPPSE